MRFYKQLIYWQSKIVSDNTANFPSPFDVKSGNLKKEILTVDEEERKLKRLRMTGEEMGMVKKLIGKRIETMCGEWAMIDLGKLFSFCLQDEFNTIN
jgi:hypothetical protein